MKKVLWYTYVTVVVIFFGYLALILGAFATDDPRTPLYEAVILGLSLFFVPVWVLVVLPARLKKDES